MTQIRILRPCSTEFPGHAQILPVFFFFNPSSNTRESWNAYIAIWNEIFGRIENEKGRTSIQFHVYYPGDTVSFTPTFEKSNYISHCRNVSQRRFTRIIRATVQRATACRDNSSTVRFILEKPAWKRRACENLSLVQKPPPPPRWQRFKLTALIHGPMCNDGRV